MGSCPPSRLCAYRIVVSISRCLANCCTCCSVAPPFNASVTAVCRSECAVRRGESRPAATIACFAILLMLRDESRLPRLFWLYDTNIGSFLENVREAFSRFSR